MIALVDCNNFYASCERVFQPHLQHKPVVILSNNDGVVVALTEEAKQLGIQRGTPAFQLKQWKDKDEVAIFSSNYSLYGDMSSRVMNTLKEMVEHIEVYSIDEAFLDLSGHAPATLETLTRKIGKTVVKNTGIPVSIGLAQTRTLAKIASKFAKKHKGYQGVCSIDTEQKQKKALQLFPIEEVWGIGRRYSKQLKQLGVHTAGDFAQKSKSWVQRIMGSNGVKTWRELNGEDCITLSSHAEKKSICTSRSLAKATDDFSILAEHISRFTALCAEKLRAQHSVAHMLTVFMGTSRFRLDLPQCSDAQTTTLSIATADTMELTKSAKEVLRKTYRKGYSYKKIGVIVSGIHTDNSIQQNLFDTIDRTQRRKISQIIDLIKKKNGKESIYLAAQGRHSAKWGVDVNYSSKRFTTNMNEIIEIK